MSFSVKSCELGHPLSSKMPDIGLISGIIELDVRGSDALKTFLDSFSDFFSNLAIIYFVTILVL